MAGNFILSLLLNLLSIFVHISGSIRPITLIWASLEISFAPAEVEYRFCQFRPKVMTSEVEERPARSGRIRPAREFKGLKCNWNEISLVRFLFNGKVLTLLGNTENFLFAYGNRKLLFQLFEVDRLSLKLAPILVRPKRRRDVTGCVPLVPRWKFRVVMREETSVQSPQKHL